MNIESRIKSVEYLQDGLTAIKLEPLNKDISAEGRGSILVEGRVSAEPGSIIDVEITISQPLQMSLELQAQASG